MTGRDELREAFKEAARIASTAADGSRFVCRMFYTVAENEAYSIGISDAALFIAEDIRTAALTAGQSGAGDGAPAGYKLVPIEPTEEMFAAARRRKLEIERAGLTPRMSEIWTALIAAAPPAPAADLGVASPGEPVVVRYTNWRGVTADRTIKPVSIYWGSNEWHQEPQWLVDAVDCDKGDVRSFALTGFGAPTPSTPEHECNIVREGPDLGPGRATEDAARESRAIETEAKRIYDSWVDQDGWVPWVHRGNSDKQNEARRQARAALAAERGRVE